MKVQYGDSCLGEGRVWDGWKDFKTADITSVMNTGVGEQLAWQMRQRNSKSSSESVTTGVTIDEIAVEFNMSHSSAWNIVHDELGCRKVCSRWVPRQLSDDHKRARQTICQEHLDLHACEGDAFLHWIVTGDESWVYHYEPESKKQSMQWKHLSSLASKKFKTQASAGKVMLTIFWDVNGPILVHFQEKGQTMTSAWYSDMLVNELKPAIWSKCQGLLSKRVFLLHDKACLHPAVHRVNTLRALKFEVLKHPPYSPDLVAPSWQRGNGGGVKLVRGHAKKLFF